MFLFGSLGAMSHDMYKAGYMELLTWDDLVHGIIWVARSARTTKQNLTLQ